MKRGIFLALFLLSAGLADAQPVRPMPSWLRFYYQPVPSGSGSGASSCNSGTPTTADANANCIFAASATTKKAFVIQAKATPTQPPFQVQQSDGTAWFTVQTDGNVIIDQRTAATYVSALDVRFQGTSQMTVGAASGIVAARVGFNSSGGAFTVDGTGNIVSLVNITGKHFMGNGTSPSIGGSCGTSPAIAGKDAYIQITTGTGSPTSCTVTFGTAYATAPTCVANAATTTTALRVTTTTTTVVVSAAALTASEVLHVVCGGF